MTTPANLVSIVRFFSPVIYQYFHEDEPRGDLLSRISYDGDWNGLNNWDNLYGFLQYAYVYTSIIEDQNRYFIHYGTYHPKDYCHSSAGHGDPECFIGIEPPGSNHENDMEGVTITVDKRFTTPTWPYGQVLTAETIYHHQFLFYHNCQIEGGYPTYFTFNTAVINMPRPSGQDNGCLWFRSSGLGATTPQPTKRFELVVDYAGHGVWMQNPAYLDGTPTYPGYITYVPSDNSAQYPTISYNYDGRPRPVSITISPSPTSYALQFLTDPELASSPNSLWDWRNLPGGPLAVSAPVAPGGSSYFTKIHGDNGAADGATVPWGQTGFFGSRGEWHNHPSWNWRRDWLPSGPSAAQYYDYCTSTDDACHYAYTYTFNPFWTPPPPPPPPLAVSISGQSSVRSGATCLWTATASTGTPPYNYSWSINGLSVSNGSPVPSELIYQNGGSPFSIGVLVTDAAAASGSATKSIAIIATAPICHY